MPDLGIDAILCVGVCQDAIKANQDKIVFVIFEGEMEIVNDTYTFSEFADPWNPTVQVGLGSHIEHGSVQSDGQVGKEEGDRWQRQSAREAGR